MTHISISIKSAQPSNDAQLAADFYPLHSDRPPIQFPVSVIDVVNGLYRPGSKLQDTWYISRYDRGHGDHFYSKLQWYKCMQLQKFEICSWFNVTICCLYNMIFDKYMVL